MIPANIMLDFIVGNFTVREIFKKFSSLDWLLLFIFVFGGAVVFAGLFRGIVGGDQVQVEYLKGEDAVQTKKIFVDVEGAVINPGVYEIPYGSRMKDALAAAGGLSETADRAFVAQNMNMAEQVVDGRKIFIPVLIPESSVKGAVLGAGERKINVNTATEAELDTLWGIGEARAQSIIKGRPYEKLEDLVTKKVLTQQIYDKNVDKLSVY